MFDLPMKFVVRRFYPAIPELHETIGAEKSVALVSEESKTVNQQNIRETLSSNPASLKKPPKPPGMTGLPSSHKNAPKPPSGPVIGNSPARSSSAKKPTQPAAGEKPPTKVQQSPNKQAPASKDSLAEFRNSLSAREQTRKASREALKQQQNQKKLEQIEAADREREELLKTFKEQEREERKKKERERAEKEAKRKERELLEERNKEAEEMAAKRWQGVLLARVFKVMRSQASETKDRMFIAGHVHHTKRLRKMLVSIMCELRERLKPRI